VNQTGNRYLPDCRQIDLRSNIALWKRFLALLAATCFALVAWGQQTALVGLPEFGVTLTGAPSEPTIVNNSGRTINRPHLAAR
jgi:hypothetical protein